VGVLTHLLVIQPPPLELFGQPRGTYKKMVDPLPDGWGLTTISKSGLSIALGYIYLQIQRRLEDAGFRRTQRSSYQRENSLLVMVWIHVLGLRSIDPMGIFPSTLEEMEVFYIPSPNDRIRLLSNTN
jgi:hypothetical protein